jgi:uncharacterized membrane protein YhaH (DUF805 family)
MSARRVEYWVSSLHHTSVGVRLFGLAVQDGDVQGSVAAVPGIYGKEMSDRLALGGVFVVDIRIPFIYAGLTLPVVTMQAKLVCCCSSG